MRLNLQKNGFSVANRAWMDGFGHLRCVCKQHLLSPKKICYAPTLLIKFCRAHDAGITASFSSRHPGTCIRNLYNVALGNRINVHMPMMFKIDRLASFTQALFSF